jgi:hypothetical protein
MLIRQVGVIIEIKVENKSFKNTSVRSEKKPVETAERILRNKRLLKGE